jgi:hypothetical protein
MPNGVIAHDPTGAFDLDALVAQAAAWPGLLGLDLAKDVTTAQSYTVAEKRWRWGRGVEPLVAPDFEVVVFDYGVKRNILRGLGDVGARCHVAPAAHAECKLARWRTRTRLHRIPPTPVAKMRRAAERHPKHHASYAAGRTAMAARINERVNGQVHAPHSAPVAAPGSARQGAVTIQPSSVSSPGGRPYKASP